MSRLRLAQVSFVMLVAACGASESKSPRLENCDDCKYTPPGTTIGSGGSSGSAGEAGAAGAGGQKAVSLSGAVNAIATGDLVTPSPYTGAVVVVAKAVGGAETTAKGMGSYALPGVASGAQWITTKPVALDALGTLTFTTIPQQDAQLNLLVVRNEALTTVLGTLPKPASLSPGAAHAIIYFRSPEGVALAATKLTPSFVAEVGHDDGPGYGGVETHGRGVAVLFNAKPAAEAMATIEHIGAKATMTLPLAADQVTMVTITITQ